MWIGERKGIAGFRSMNGGGMRVYRLGDVLRDS